MVALWQVGEVTSSSEENANLYIRGVNESRAREPLVDMLVLEILEVFGVGGLRSYILGHMEGLGDAIEDEEEQSGGWEMRKDDTHSAGGRSILLP